MLRRNLTARLLATFVSLAILGSLLPVKPVAASSSSDIPGIPLPASVVSGELGGPIYDVVYSITAKPGQVLVAGLTGTPGTDFDLYLFDSSATTVVANQGVLTKSTGPNSSEHISWASAFGGTYYLDLNGASNVEGTYTLSVQVVPDATPPTLSIAVDGGVPSVNTANVQVQIAAFDDLSGIADASLSNDGVNWSDWKLFSPAVSWALSPGDGAKTVWVRVRNGVGLISPPASASIRLDTAPPSVVGIVPAPDTSVSTLRPAIRVTFSEPIQADSWATSGLFMQDSSGAIVTGAYAYDGASETGTFTPSSDLTLGIVYVLTVGGVRDTAGNVAGPVGSWTLKVLTATSATIAARPIVLTSGGSVRLSGALHIPLGESANLEILRPGAKAWAPLSLPPLSGTAFDVFVAPQTNGSYRVSYEGSATAASATSSPVRVLVRRTVRILGSTPAITRSAVGGKTISIVASIAPAGAARVSFQLYRWDGATRTYRYTGSLGRTTTSAGFAAIQWTPSVGRYEWRVSVLPSPDFANNVSAFYRWTVSR